MTKVTSVFMGVALAASLGGASAFAASAEPLAPVEGRSVDLGGDVHGTIYYIAEYGDAYRIVTTIDSGPDSTPVRFEAVLADGQSVEVSTPRAVGQRTLTVLIQRTGGQVNVSETSDSAIN